MLKSEIQPGTDYALREKREIGAPFQRVRIIEHIRKNKWRAKWVEPNPGLIDYVESVQLIVPWKERKAFLKEEESTERLRNHNRAIGYEDDSPVAKALACCLSVLLALVLAGGTLDVLCRWSERATGFHSSSVRRIARECLGDLGFVIRIDLGVTAGAENSLNGGAATIDGERRFQECQRALLEAAGSHVIDLPIRPAPKLPSEILG